ncbi:hypothetical protein QWJ34_14360 [Saccharibacillus sp. CPCC 101409]|uniref:hypothetical protein n=1 Tax=Saccharibacillus sp. CPCC 101409 TaxID=3058041 RepID=UPI002671ED8C|nr:hypothetical protein [Saccharibacillus sp. CPCC 101409]MDO3410944.1 hypothetical protein [Saccharibacillus sp. CPCC 101409]
MLIFLLSAVLALAGCSKDSAPLSIGGSQADSSGGYKPAGTGSIDLERLQGMYYGFSPDYDGSECGGMCWNIYTFLPDQKVVVDAPPSGGPETIDCGDGSCQTYKIENGQLIIEGEEAPLGIETADGKLLIDEVELQPVEPVQDGLTLDQNYTHEGFSGLVGISAGSSSWTETLTLRPDGTYEGDDFMIGSVEGGDKTSGAAGGASTGTYRIGGNTIEFTDANGETTSELFFIQAEDDSIQVGDRNFWIE